jgi:hypothetical protein
MSAIFSVLHPTLNRLFSKVDVLSIRLPFAVFEVVLVYFAVFIDAEISAESHIWQVITLIIQ